MSNWRERILKRKQREREKKGKKLARSRAICFIQRHLKLEVPSKLKSCWLVKPEHILHVDCWQHINNSGISLVMLSDIHTALCCILIRLHRVMLKNGEGNKERKKERKEKKDQKEKNETMRNCLCKGNVFIRLRKKRGKFFWVVEIYASTISDSFWLIRKLL